MDQLLTQFGVAWPKFLAQVILFLIVYAILRKFAFGPIIAIFEQRRRTIEEGQSNAEKIRRQLAESEIRCQEILRKANSDAQRIIDEARASSEASTQKHIQQAVKDAENIIVKANESVSLERARMVAEVKSEMVHLVVDTTARVVGKVLTEADQERLASETSKQLAA
jgi:F-type H+-transporting ATPase subunit b